MHDSIQWKMAKLLQKFQACQNVVEVHPPKPSGKFLYADFESSILGAKHVAVGAVAVDGEGFATHFFAFSVAKIFVIGCSLRSMRTIIVFFTILWPTISLLSCNI